MIIKTQFQKSVSVMAVCHREEHREDISFIFLIQVATNLKIMQFDDFHVKKRPHNSFPPSLFLQLIHSNQFPLTQNFQLDYLTVINKKQGFREMRVERDD